MLTMPLKPPLGTAQDGFNKALHTRRHLLEQVVSVAKPLACAGLCGSASGFSI